MEVESLLLSSLSVSRTLSQCKNSCWIVSPSFWIFISTWTWRFSLIFLSSFKFFLCLRRSALLIDSLSVQVIDERKQVIRAPTLLFSCATPPLHPYLWHVGQQLFLGVSPCPLHERTKFVYCSRNDSTATNPGRRVTNEIDLLHRIRSKLRDIDPRFDLVIFNASHYTPLPLSDTVAFFSDARGIIGPHGGCLTNVVFLGCNSLVVEFMPHYPNGETPVGHLQMMFVPTSSLCSSFSHLVCALVYLQDVYAVCFPGAHIGNSGDFQSLMISLWFVVSCFRFLFRMSYCLGSLFTKSWELHVPIDLVDEILDAALRLPPSWPDLDSSPSHGFLFVHSSLTNRQRLMIPPHFVYYQIFFRTCWVEPRYRTDLTLRIRYSLFMNLGVRFSWHTRPPLSLIISVTSIWSYTFMIRAHWFYLYLVLIVPLASSYFVYQDEGCCNKVKYENL